MTLLFDDTKKLEKALGEEAAGVIIGILEKQDKEAKQELVTKEHLDHRLNELELRMTIRLGAIAASSIAVMASIIKFLS